MGKFAVCVSCAFAPLGAKPGLVENVAYYCYFFGAVDVGLFFSAGRSND